MTNRKRRPLGVDVVKHTHVGTREKRYTPIVRGKALRLSWKTKTHAEIYGAMILNRYVKKLKVMAELKTRRK